MLRSPEPALEAEPGAAGGDSRSERECGDDDEVEMVVAVDWWRWVAGTGSDRGAETDRETEKKVSGIGSEECGGKKTDSSFLALSWLLNVEYGTGCTSTDGEKRIEPIVENGCDWYKSPAG